MPKVIPLTADAKIQDNLKRITRQTKHDLDDAGITLTQVAAALNKSPSTICAQFKGRATIQVEVLIAAEMLIRGEI